VDGNVNLEKLITGSAVFFLQTHYLISHVFPPNVYILFHIFPLKLRKWDLKYLLGIDIIKIITWFMVRTTYDEFQTSTKVISQRKSYTCMHP